MLPITPCLKRSMLYACALLSTKIYCGESSKQMLALHQEIGKELLLMRTENPALQPKVFALIDKVSSLYRLAQETTKKKKHYKLALNEQCALLDKLKRDNTSIQATITNLKNEQAQASAKLAQNAKTQAKPVQESPKKISSKT
jgi:hypothetical protein